MRLFRQRSMLFTGVLPRPRLPKMASCADVMDTFHSSNSGTGAAEVSVWADDSTEKGILPQSHPRVMFCETRNETYSSPWLIDLDRNGHAHDKAKATQTAEKPDGAPWPSSGSLTIVSQKAIWYDKIDIAKFKHEQQVYGRMVLNREKLQTNCYRSDIDTAHLPWSNAVAQAYQGLYRATSVEEMNDVMAGADSLQMDPIMVGLEKWITPELRGTRASQRTVLIKVILSRQRLDSALQLRRLSRRLSRPGRLFAIYLGKVVHET